MYTEVNWDFVPYTTSELLHMNKLSQPCDAETICKMYDETFAHHLDDDINIEFKNYIRAIEDKLQFKVSGLKFCGFDKDSLESAKKNIGNLSTSKVFLCINNVPFPVVNVSVDVQTHHEKPTVINKQFDSAFTHLGGHYSKHTSRVITKMKDCLREYTLTDMSRLWDGIRCFHKLCARDIIDVAYVKLKRAEENIGFRRKVSSIVESHPLMDTFKNILENDIHHSAQHVAIREYIDAFNDYDNCSTNLTNLKSFLVYTKTDQNNFQRFQTQQIEFTETSWKFVEPKTIYSVDALPEEILNRVYALSVLPSVISKRKDSHWHKEFSNVSPWKAEETFADCFSSSMGLHIGEGIYYVIL